MTEIEDRYRTLFEIGNAIVSNLDKDRLFQTIAEQIKKSLPFDRAAITFYDPVRDSFKIHRLETTIAPLHLNQDMEVPRHGSAVGWVLDHQEHLLRPDLAKERQFIEDELFYREGLRCAATFPLFAGGRIFGTFNIASKTPGSYAQTEIEFLSLVASQIAVALDNARAYQKIEELKNALDRENIYLRDEIKTEYNFEEIIGTSAVLRKALQRVEDVAGTDSSVLITGETGTGKELVARAIHHLSKRKHRALIKVNCAALPAGLIESELFGHEKGAFTGAISKKIGRFELADGGTLFLDEIGDLPQEIQAKLLRALQEREFERVGGTQTLTVNVRVIAATNRDLGRAVADKTFRADLYYRLNVFPVHLPALRERTEDIPLLAQYFVNKYMIRMGKRIEEIGRESLDRLMAYSWPGNIRELENIIERAVILSKGRVLEVEDDLAVSTDLPQQDEHPPRTLQEVERDHIIKTLRATRWRIEGPKGAAKQLNMHPNTLRSRMNKLNIQRAHHDIP